MAVSPLRFCFLPMSKRQNTQMQLVYELDKKLELAVMFSYSKFPDKSHITGILLDFLRRMHQYLKTAAFLDSISFLIQIYIVLCCEFLCFFFRFGFNIRNFCLILAWFRQHHQYLFNTILVYSLYRKMNAIF